MSHVLNELFDKVFVISIDDRRLEHFRSYADGLVFEHCQGTTPADLSFPEGINVPGRICVLCSHFRCVKFGVETGQRVLIFEDDAILKPQVTCRETLATRPDYADILMLGSGLERGRRFVRNDWWHLEKGSWWGLWAYGFMSLEVQAATLDLIKQCPAGQHIDNFLRTRMGAYSIVRPYEALVRQAKLGSTS